MASSRLVWFRRLALAGTLLALLVIVLGGWVRLNAAGLGCPDWPGCYGHLTAGEASRNLEVIGQLFPDARPFEYEKALKEMIHRYFAGGLGLIIVALAGIALWNRRDPLQPVTLPIALVAVVTLQGLLGMWTVTLLLKPLVVVLHLVGGLATMGLLAWLATRPAEVPAAGSDRRLARLTVAGLAVLAVQIVLGGWTSTNYAALACPDFPTCQASYWPQMDFRDAFVLWRGLGIDYEGGVLDHPARVAIHFVHRLGAVVTAVVLGTLAWLAWRHGSSVRVRRAGVAVAVVLAIQLILGPVMVLKGLPLALATAHNGVAALLVLAMVRLLRVLTPAAAVTARAPEPAALNLTDSAGQRA
ncbi:MAG TPA: COX15/CtaA family protein [Steroidobacteraceae bacterium]|nr:COX15/CtaA family protein [Steroidobacteraceae bacterium]